METQMRSFGSEKMGDERRGAGGLAAPAQAVFGLGRETQMDKARGSNAWKMEENLHHIEQLPELLLLPPLPLPPPSPHPQQRIQVATHCSLLEKWALPTGEVSLALCSTAACPALCHIPARW